MGLKSLSELMTKTSWGLKPIASTHEILHHDTFWQKVGVLVQYSLGRGESLNPQRSELRRIVWRTTPTVKREPRTVCYITGT